MNHPQCPHDISIDELFRQWELCKDKKEEMLFPVRFWMKTPPFISLLISLTLAACGGGVSRDSGKGDTLALADTIAMLSEVETMYVGDERPDSAVLEMFMCLPEFQERGVPLHLSLIGSNSNIPEDRVSLFNIATPEELFGGKRRFLEAEWTIDSTEYLRHIYPPFSPDGFQCHLRISYEILPDTLITVDTLYYHDGIEF